MMNKLYNKTSKMRSKTEKSIESKIIAKEYMKFLKDNNLMNLSDYYYNNINERKNIIENTDYTDIHIEYNEYKKIFIEMLELVDEISIYPFWQNINKLKVKGIKEVYINDLKIEDLVFHPYHHLLTIKK